MRILHIPHSYAPVVGGTQHLCQRVSEQLVQRMHKVDVITSNASSSASYSKFGISKVEPRNEINAGVNVERLPYINGWYNFASYLYQSRVFGKLSKKIAIRIFSLNKSSFSNLLTKRIKDIAPDVVMTMPGLARNVVVVLEAKQKFKFPLVMLPMLHEHAPNWDIENMKSALRNADAVISLTPYESKQLAENYAVPKEKIFIASVGIEVEDEVEFYREAKQVLFLGRKAPYKGIDKLIDAMCHVWQKMPEIKLCLAGPNTSKRGIIDRQIQSLPAQFRENVSNIGTVSVEEKSNLLNSSCCLVLPSKIESFGIVILEAWAHGTPVITWDLPVFRSTVDNKTDGLLVEPDNTLKLSEAILSILEEENFAQKLGKAGYEKAKSSYSWENVVAQYLRAYEFAIQNCSCSNSD